MEQPGVSTRPKPRVPLWPAIVAFGMSVMAPCAGLLGTVLGLRSSFRSVETVDPSEKARRLAEGISASMDSLAYGLIASLALLVIGIVLLVVHLRSKAKQSLPEQSAGPRP